MSEDNDIRRLMNEPMIPIDDVLESTKALRDDIEERRLSQIRQDAGSGMAARTYGTPDMGKMQKSYEALQTEAERMAFMEAWKIMKGA